jgi:hypothetical protein
MSCLLRCSCLGFVGLFLLGSFGYWLVRPASLWTAGAGGLSSLRVWLQVWQNKCDMDANLRDLLFYTTNAFAAHKIPFWLDYGLSPVCVCAALPHRSYCVACRYSVGYRA